MKYRIYIDEVGNPDLESSDNENHRFLSLTGAIIDLEHVRETVHPQLEALKGEFFSSHPDEPIILHRKEMVNKKKAFTPLRNREIEARFNQTILERLNDWDYSVITVCIDKKKHLQKYAGPYEPYHFCLEVLLERFFFFLNGRGREGDVMAEARGGKEDRRLKDVFSKLWAKGTGYVSPGDIQRVLTSKQLKIREKHHNVSGLQLADLVAHSSRNEILQDEGLFQGKIYPFGQQIIDVLQGKYYQANGRCYGKKFL